MITNGPSRRWQRRRLPSGMRRLIPFALLVVSSGCTSSTRLGVAGNPPRITDTGYNRETIAIMRRVLPANGTGIDVGAFKGELTRGLLQAAPHGRHWAIEPQPEYAARLQQAFPQVTVLPIALGDSTGTVSFVQAVQAPARSSLRRQDYPKGEEQTRDITVRLARLDDVIPDSQPVHLIKADVEGAEYLVFRGAYRTVQRWHPVLVFEYGHAAQAQFQVTPDMIWQLLTETHGYRLYRLRDYLADRPPLTASEFVQSVKQDWMFVAVPRP
jgi:FkbM family methyltransferase